MNNYTLNRSAIIQARTTRTRNTIKKTVFLIVFIIATSFLLAGPSRADQCQETIDRLVAEAKDQATVAVSMKIELILNKIINDQIATFHKSSNRKAVSVLIDNRENFVSCSVATDNTKSCYKTHIVNKW